jgi:hypothetical protein
LNRVPQPALTTPPSRLGAPTVFAAVQPIRPPGVIGGYKSTPEIAEVRTDPAFTGADCANAIPAHIATAAIQIKQFSVLMSRTVLQ